MQAARWVPRDCVLQDADHPVDVRVCLTSTELCGPTGTGAEATWHSVDLRCDDTGWATGTSGREGWGERRPRRRQWAQIRGMPQAYTRIRRRLQNRHPRGLRTGRPGAFSASCQGANAQHSSLSARRCANARSIWGPRLLHLRRAPSARPLPFAYRIRRARLRHARRRIRSRLPTGTSGNPVLDFAHSLISGCSRPNSPSRRIQAPIGKASRRRRATRRWARNRAASRPRSTKYVHALAHTFGWIPASRPRKAALWRILTR